MIGFMSDQMLETAPRLTRAEAMKPVFMRVQVKI